MCHEFASIWVKWLNSSMGLKIFIWADFSSIMQSCLLSLLTRPGRLHLRQCRCMSGHCGKCSSSMSIPGTVTWHPSIGEPMTRIGHAQTWLDQVCPGVPRKAQPFGQRKTCAVEPSCAHRWEAGQGRISPIRNPCMLAGLGADLRMDHGAYGPERSMKCCLIHRSLKRCRTLRALRAGETSHGISSSSSGSVCHPPLTAHLSPARMRRVNIDACQTLL